MWRSVFFDYMVLHIECQFTPPVLLFSNFAGWEIMVNLPFLMHLFLLELKLIVLPKLNSTIKVCNHCTKNVTLEKCFLLNRHSKYNGISTLVFHVVLGYIKYFLIINFLQTVLTVDTLEHSMCTNIDGRGRP